MTQVKRCASLLGLIEYYINQITVNLHIITDENLDFQTTDPCLLYLNVWSRKPTLKFVINYSRII